MLTRDRLADLKTTIEIAHIALMSSFSLKSEVAKEDLRSRAAGVIAAVITEVHGDLLGPPKRPKD